MPVNLIVLYILYHRRHAVVKDRDYLAVIHFDHWTPGRKIKEEMEELHSGWLGHLEVYAALSRLEDAGLVERRVIEESFDQVALKVHEFRRKPGGICARDVEPLLSLSPSLMPA